MDDNIKKRKELKKNTIVSRNPDFEFNSPIIKKGKAAVQRLMREIEDNTIGSRNPDFEFNSPIIEKGKAAMERLKKEVEGDTIVSPEDTIQPPKRTKKQIKPLSK